VSKKTSNVGEKHREIVRQLALAEQGEAAAQNSIGAALAQGSFVDRDLAGALYWYAQAVKQGYTHAKFNAGTMLILGEGMAVAHTVLGMALVKQAAEAGDPSARNFLSQCYAEGSFGLAKGADTSNQWRVRSNAPFIEYGEGVDIEAEGIELSKPSVGGVGSK
jgi:TPR repeat protein